jgi:hypothetical protein
MALTAKQRKRPTKALLELKNEHAFGFALAQRKLIAANGDLDRIAERRHLANENLDALGDAHVHNVTLEGTFAHKAAHRGGLADGDIAQRLVLTCFKSRLIAAAFRAVAKTGAMRPLLQL